MINVVISVFILASAIANVVCAIRNDSKELRVGIVIYWMLVSTYWALHALGVA